MKKESKKGLPKIDAPESPKMKEPRKEPEKTEAKKELKGVEAIISEALSRIISMTTKRTYMQEVKFIAKEIDNYYSEKYILMEIDND